MVLYSYQAEQRGWLRMVGPQWRHLLAAVPGLSPDQEYVPTGEVPRSTQLVGGYAGGEYEAVADLPGGFRVLAMTRAARYPVDRRPAGCGMPLAGRAAAWCSGRRRGGCGCGCGARIRTRWRRPGRSATNGACTRRGRRAPR